MKTKHHKRSFSLSAVLAASIATTGISEGAIASYYVGIDGLQTIASGTYAGLANPNYNRLTFLFAHSYADAPATNHYHSKATLTYSGPASSPTVITSASNYVPEGSNPPLTLSITSGGLYDGKLISSPIAGNEFSHLGIEDTAKLNGFAAGSGESVMFNSSNGRWNGALIGADVHLTLLSLSAGLNVGGSTTLNLFATGNEQHLGGSFSFTPTFWMDAGAAAGSYTAQFKLTDESGTFGDSGVFEYRFTVVPEPSTALLGVVGMLALLRRRR